MREIQSSPTEVLRPDPQSRREAGTTKRRYLFVLAAIEYLQGQLPARRHVTAARNSCWACRDLALERSSACWRRTVLATLGHHSTGDFGRIVFTLVEVGLLVTQPGDSEEDFDGVYEFADAFSPTEVWDRVSGA